MPSDYFSGFIKNSAGKEVTQISGSYLGYIDFDDIRYWTYDSVVPHKVKKKKKRNRNQTWKLNLLDPFLKFFNSQKYSFTIFWYTKTIKESD